MNKKREVERYRAMQHISLPEETGRCTWRAGEWIDAARYADRPDYLESLIQRGAIERVTEVAPAPDPAAPIVTSTPTKEGEA